MLLQTLCHRYLLTLPHACWQMIKDPCSKTCRIPFAFGSWTRGTSAQLPDAKYSYLFKRRAKSAQGRNGINGGDPRSGEEAVYAGFGLEQTQRSATRAGLTTPTVAIKLSQEPLKAAHQRKFDIVVFWALNRLTREGTRATLNYLQRLESKGVGYVSYQEQWLDSTGPFKDVMISMFATLAKQERARISERTIAGLKVARVKGKRLGRPPLPEETVRTVLSLNQDAGIGARKIAKSTGFPLGTVSAILSRSRQETC